jgi:hypothetical protein
MGIELNSTLKVGGPMSVRVLLSSSHWPCAASGAASTKGGAGGGSNLEQDQRKCYREGQRDQEGKRVWQSGLEKRCSY